MRVIPKMLQAIIFDMDGLLIDSESVWDSVRQAMAAEASRDWTSDDHKAVMGVSTQEWVDYMIRRLDLSLSPQQVEDDLAQSARVTPERAAEHFLTGLASGSHRTLINTVTADPALQGKFQVILSADEVGAGKPSPDVYLETAKRLGVSCRASICKSG